MFKITQKMSADNAKIEPTNENIAAILRTSQKALEKFESLYKKEILPEYTEGFFDKSVKQAKNTDPQTAVPDNSLIERAVSELLSQTPIIRYKNEKIESIEYQQKNENPITKEELMSLPGDMRPQATGRFMKADLDPKQTGETLIYTYERYLREKNPEKRKNLYHIFRQGLDLVDLDGLSYAMLDKNINAIGFWFPALANANQKHRFFKIPDTTIIKVPLSLLQLSRTEYSEINAVTKKILNDFCFRVFELDDTKDYFVKTGTYSSKFDFRNTHVTAGKEVHELGEYLLYISHTAANMASPLCSPCIYGVSTTNQWCVREYIHPKETVPTIYKGLPLRTEYRFFVDLDEKTVIGKSPYWESDLMKNRFENGSDKESPHQIHDAITFRAQEPKLVREYNENIEMLTERVKELILDIELTGQWSLDVMQNGDDFYLIDMAGAATSALRKCVPKGLLKAQRENWLPEIPE